MERNSSTNFWGKIGKVNFWGNVKLGNSVVACCSVAIQIVNRNAKTMTTDLGAGHLTATCVSMSKIVFRIIVVISFCVLNYVI